MHYGLTGIVEGCSRPEMLTEACTPESLDLKHKSTSTETLTVSLYTFYLDISSLTFSQTNIVVE